MDRLCGGAIAIAAAVAVALIITVLLAFDVTADGLDEPYVDADAALSKLRYTTDNLPCGHSKPGSVAPPPGMFERGLDPNACEIQMANELVNGASAQEYQCDMNNVALANPEIIESIAPANDGVYCIVRFQKPIVELDGGQLNRYLEDARSRAPMTKKLIKERDTARADEAARRQELKSLNEEINNLQAEIRRLDKDIRDKTAYKGVIEQAIASVDQDWKTESANLTNLDAEIMDKNARITDLTSQIQALQTRMAELDVRKKEIERVLKAQSENRRP